MKKAAAMIIFLVVILAGCAPYPMATYPMTTMQANLGSDYLNSQATQNAVAYASQQTQQAVDYSALSTQQAIDAQNSALARADLMATQAVQQTQLAIDSLNAQNNARATEIAQNQAQVELNIRASEAAAALSISSTATQAYNSTMTALEASGKQLALSATQQAMTVQQKKDIDEANMQAVMMWINAGLKSVLIVSGLVFIAFIVFRLVKAKTEKMSAYEPDEHGRYPVVRVGHLLVDMNRSVNPVISTIGVTHSAPSAEMQMQVTENDQRINLAWATASGTPQPPQVMDFSRQQYQILDASGRPPERLLGDVVSALDSDWSDNADQ